MSTIPRPVTIGVPLGDSRIVRFPPPRDTRDGTIVDPGSYQEIRVGFALASDFEPFVPVAPAVVSKTLSTGQVSLDAATKEISVVLAPEDTLLLGLGRFVIHLRLERGEATRHSVAPFHVLEITPSGLG